MGVKSRAEIGEGGNVMEAGRMVGHRAEKGACDPRTVEPLEQGRQAGQRDDELRDSSGAQECPDRRVEEAQRRVQLTVRGVQEGGVTGQEALEEPDVVLAELCDALVQVSSARCGSAFDQASPTIQSV